MMTTSRVLRRSLLLGVLFALATLTTHAAEPWKPADGPLMTRWAADVSPDNAWREYPRPQMVRPEWVNLNGLWDYAIRPVDEQEVPAEMDGKILVPFCVESALSGVMKKVGPDNRLWYRRNFEAPKQDDGGRLLLHFGAVDWHAIVWVNGEKAGEHKGGYDPFSFDITDLLVKGTNELVLSVWDPTSAGFQPRGKQVLQPKGIWYTAVTGIWQTAWLEPVPATHIRSLKIVPDVDDGAVNVTVDASAKTAVRVEVLDGDTPVGSSQGHTGQAVRVPIPEPKLWSPDSPHLYDVKVTLADGDAIGSYFGMRKIEMAKDEAGINRLKLNGEVLFQYGPLDQGWWPDGLYTPASDEALRYDVEVTKRLGMNMARKHVKIEPARWYYWCDRLGLLVWQDMPSGNAGASDESKANFEQELQAMIRAYGNHPSIVMWVPFNEGWGQHDTERYVELVKQWDPTRLVNNTSGWTDKGVGDVHDVHKYPGPAMPELEETRAAVLGEFGGLGLPLPGHTWQAEKNWGYRSFETPEALTDAYVNLLDRLRPLIGRGLSAAVYTQTSDVEVEVNGLMTYDRDLIKMDLDRVAEAASKLYLPPPIIKQVVPTAQQAPQAWRYTTEEPGKSWPQPTFDDSAWKEGPSGFGTETTPGAIIGTTWKEPNIWLRRDFTLDAIPETLQLVIHHDEDVRVYLNGVLAAEQTGFTSDYGTLPITPTALEALCKGTNTLAVHCLQTKGGQYIDVGLVEVVEHK